MLGLLGQFAFNIVCTDTLLYWNHRTLHWPMFYARFHKQHHEVLLFARFATINSGPCPQYKSPIPVSSEYFTLTEELLTGVIPTLSGANVVLLGLG